MRSHLGVESEMKNCTPLWREAHFEVKMPKAPHQRTTFGSCHVEKVKAVVARSPLWREAHLEVKMYKAHHVRSTCGSCDVPKVAVKMYKTHHVQSTCGSCDVQKVRAPMGRKAHVELKMYNVHNTSASEHF